MKVLAHKRCNICNQVVATKKGLRYHTDRYYVTLRSDAYSYDSATEKDEVHICEDCWLELKLAIDRNKNKLS